MSKGLIAAVAGIVVLTIASMAVIYFATEPDTRQRAAPASPRAPPVAETEPAPAAAAPPPYTPPPPAAVAPPAARPEPRPPPTAVAPQQGGPRPDDPAFETDVPVFGPPRPPGPRPPRRGTRGLGPRPEDE